MRVVTYPDEVAEAIRDLIWEELGEELELQRCQQDQYEGFPLEDLASRLPAVIVRAGRSPAPEPDIPEYQVQGGLQSWRVTYSVDVIYAQELAEDGEPNRGLNRAGGRLRDLFLQGACLSDLSPGPGFRLVSVRPGDYDPHSGRLALDARSVWLGEVHIPVTVETVAYPTEQHEEVG